MLHLDHHRPGISMKEYVNFQNEMQQMSKITIMIRDEYKKFKIEMNNVVKQKIEAEKQGFRQS